MREAHVSTTPPQQNERRRRERAQAENQTHRLIICVGEQKLVYILRGGRSDDA